MHLETGFTWRQAPYLHQNPDTGALFPCNSGQGAAGTGTRQEVCAGGYGNGYVLDYFKRRYAELSDGTPYP